LNTKYLGNFIPKGYTLKKILYPILDLDLQARNTATKFF
jgi:hypothetical protein